MKTTKCGLAMGFGLGVLLLAGVTNARADAFNFLLTDGVQTMTWTLPSTPNSYSLGNYIRYTGITVLENGTTPVTASMTFWNLATQDGGLSANSATLIN